MTADEVSKNTTPNAVREATNDSLDHIYNCAVSNLRHADAGVVKQMEQSILAISEERAFRRARWPFRISVLALAIAACSAAFTVWGLLRPDLRHRVETLEREHGTLSPVPLLPTPTPP